MKTKEIVNNSIENLLGLESNSESKEQIRDFMKLMSYYKCAMMEIKNFH